MSRARLNDSMTGMSHHSWVRWPKTTPMLRAFCWRLLVRHEAVHDEAAGGGDEDAGQHLDRGRLAGAVGPEVRDRLAGLDAEVDVVDGQLVLVGAGEEVLERADQARAP